MNQHKNFSAKFWKAIEDMDAKAYYKFITICFAIFMGVMGTNYVAKLILQKELRVKYFETATVCYESSKANPVLAAVCPVIKLDDVELK